MFSSSPMTVNEDQPIRSQMRNGHVKVKPIETDHTKMAEWIEVGASAIDRSRYRAFLHHLGTHLTTRNVDELVFLADLPDGNSQNIKSPLSLFQSLELHGYLKPSPSGLDYLKENLAIINRIDLSRKVELFVTGYLRAQENSEKISPSRPPQSIIPNAMESPSPRSRLLKKPSDYNTKGSSPTLNDDSSVATTEEYTSTVPSKKQYNRQAVSNEDHLPEAQMSLKAKGSLAVEKDKLVNLKTSEGMKFEEDVCNEKLPKLQPIKASEDENSGKIFPPVDHEDNFDEEDQEEGLMKKSYCFPSAPVVPHFEPKTTESSDFYNMESIPRGMCVILNNEYFNNANGSEYLEDRDGSHVDARMLQGVFKYLSFDVRVVENLSAEEVKNYFTKIAKEDHSKYDCFVGCVLSHGCNDGLYGVDGEVVTIEEILSGFKTCPTLKGKPKIFFGQFCRGDNVDMVYVADSKTRNSIFRENPSEADFFIAYATPPGYVSWRSPSNGTWFISKLCQWLQHGAHELDLDQIMKKVKKDVGESYTSKFQKQIPFVCDTLTKRVKFL